MEVNQDPAGKNDSPADNQENQKNISRETYLKVLEERKRDKERREAAEAKIAEYEAEKAAAEKAALESQKKYEELYKKTQEELAKERGEKESYRKSLVDSYKTQSVLEKLPGKLRKTQYVNFIDVDSIELDENGVVVDDTALAQANFLLKEYPELIETKSNNSMPSDAPRGGKKLSYEEWTRLPFQEQRKRLKDVMK